MHLHPCNSKQDYDQLLAADRFRDQYLIEQHLARGLVHHSEIIVPGICMVCDQPVDFRTDRSKATLERGVWQAHWREQQVCSVCGLNSRQRATIGFIGSVVRRCPPQDRMRIYMMEQTTPVFARVAQSFAAADVIGSEYLGARVASGAVIDGIRNENAECLSLGSGTVDLIVSNDVLEHVFDPVTAFAECCRVLKPGGELFVTVPFLAGNESNITRAVMRDGEVVDLLPRQYHRDPRSANGALVVTDFGWEILVQLCRAGFAAAQVVIFWSYLYGYLGFPQPYFHAVKSS